MDKEIRDILKNTGNGEKVITYIEELEEHLERHCHSENCSCHNGDSHCQSEDCDCGCHGEEKNEWEEIKTNYKSNLTVKDWEKLLKEEEIFNIDSLQIIKRMRHIAAPTTSMELADMFGFGAFYYKNETEKLEERLVKKLNLTNIETKYLWAIIFDGYENKKTEEQIYALKPELYEALGNIDLSNIKLRENEV